MLTFIEGGGLVNSLINKLPVELHLKGYNFCGPGTNLTKRLQRGDVGVNELDEACKEHDIAYNKSTELSDRHQADQILEDKAWKRVKSKDAKLGERGAALFVSGIMKAKRKLGMGCKNKPFRATVVTPVKKLLKQSLKSGLVTDGNLKKSTLLALRAARAIVRKAGGRKQIRVPRMIPFESKSGGVLPLVPIFAGLSALGMLMSGGSTVAKTVIDARNAAKKLEEEHRHNKAVEMIGNGLFVKKSKRGCGLYLKKQKNYQ